MDVTKGFDPEEIKKNYPKSYQKLLDYFSGQLEKQKAVSPELDESFTPEWTTNLNLTFGWKGLIYFFDIQKINISFTSEHFNYTFSVFAEGEEINNNPAFIHMGKSPSYETRIECEYKAIEQAFKVLENL